MIYVLLHRFVIDTFGVVKTTIKFRLPTAKQYAIDWMSWKNVIFIEDFLVEISTAFSKAYRVLMPSERLLNMFLLLIGTKRITKEK